jgi:hypothetical protein
MEMYGGVRPHGDRVVALVTLSNNITNVDMNMQNHIHHMFSIKKVLKQHCFKKEVNHTSLSISPRRKYFFLSHLL